MPDRPNILVFVSDEHSPMSLGCYGHPFVQTPNLDRLANTSVIFDAAYCNSPLCVPSRLSFLTGLYPWRIGAWDLLSHPPKNRTTIASHLSQNGYYTATMGKWHFLGDDQMQGFDYRPYGDFLGASHQPDPIEKAPHLTLHPAGPAEVPEAAMQETIVNRLATQFLQEYDRDELFLLWVSYNRPHFPLRPPARYWDRYYPDYADLPELGPDFPDRLHPWMQGLREFYKLPDWTEDEKRQARAAYYVCVTFIDDKIGEVLTALEEYGHSEDTVVLYFSDHGEMNGEHDMWCKSNFYEQSVRVPLIMSYPGELPQDLRVSNVVELVDLYPTLAELAGAPVLDGLDGSSLLPLMRSGSDAGRKGYAISEYYGHGVPNPMRMIRMDDWKYILYLDAKQSLFNLTDDPDEYHDLIDEPGEPQRIAAKCDRLLREDWDEPLARANFQRVDERMGVQSPRKLHAPNQFMTEDGQYIDAETLYPGVFPKSEKRKRG